MSKQAPKPEREVGTGPAGEASLEEALDRLEQQRQSTEAGFRDRLAGFDAEAERLAKIAADALEAARRIRQIAVRGMDESRSAFHAALVKPGPRPTWPESGGFLRQRLNGLLRWALRDYLMTLDRRADAAEARLDALSEVVDQLFESARLLSGRAAGDRSADADTPAATIDDVLECASAALAAIGQVQESMLELVNAKDAEVLQRAAAGPLRRMEVVFDEFGRQQEALLAELVGKRQELDALIDRVASASPLAKASADTEGS